MPVIDRLAVEYADSVDFVAPAWKADFQRTEARANELLTSGLIKWGLDENEEVFSAYGVPYQPVTVLVGADGTIVEAWAGMRDETEIRAALDNLAASSS